jgi:fluoride ion exporter CrcB/FEX
MKHSLIVFLGSGLGGVARHLLNHFMTALTGSGFPWGILTINVTGSTAIGLVAGWFAFRGNAPGDVRLFLTAGILGGYTTPWTPPCSMSAGSHGLPLSMSLHRYCCRSSVCLSGYRLSG